MSLNPGGRPKSLVRRGRVIERPVYRTEFYDPQVGVCLLVQPGQVRAWVRMQ